MMAYRTIDPFYPVVPDAAWVARLVQAGARFVQLRFKGEDPAAIAREITAALAACAATGAELVVNDHWQAAIEARANLCPSRPERPSIRPIFRRCGGMASGSASARTTTPSSSADCRPTPITWPSAPSIPTTLKVMPWGPQGLDRIGEWKRLVGSRPLVAIGGITLDRVPGCLAAGADSVAVVSDIVAHVDPEARTGAWLMATQRVT